MAAIVFSEGDLLCPQCSEIYCLPVRLQCGHNICRVCLHKYWEWKGSRECPVCHAVSVPGRPPINLELKLAAEKYQALTTVRNQDVCVHHNKKLTLFCQNDEEPICLVCQVSRQHKVHECCTLEEAVLQKKTWSSLELHRLQRKPLPLLQDVVMELVEVQTLMAAEITVQLEPLRRTFRILSKTKVHWEETKNHIQNQANQNEKAIKEEFKKLHLFLQEEENIRLKVLKREEDVKTQVMSEKLELIKSQIKTLSALISDIEKTLTAADLQFLQDYKQTKKKVKCNIREPECIRDILINSAQHLGLLKFGIWKKMHNIVKYVPVTLDPNTAQANLTFSDELTSVQYSSKRLLPDNPERCTSRLCVLGATGFTSGKHSWTVDVSQGKEWYVGVAQESIKRKTAAFISPAEGFWVIGLHGDFIWAQTSPRTKLLLKQKPERITIELDCDKGKVVFINAADLTQIHTFKDKFTERIYPYLSPGLHEVGGVSSPLTICPLNITVDVK